MANAIVFGELKDGKVDQPVVSDPNKEQKERIILKQRRKADIRATFNQLQPTRPYQYAFVEIDPMPELPLD